MKQGLKIVYTTYLISNHHAFIETIDYRVERSLKGTEYGLKEEKNKDRLVRGDKVLKSIHYSPDPDEEKSSNVQEDSFLNDSLITFWHVVHRKTYPGKEVGVYSKYKD